MLPGDIEELIDPNYGEFSKQILKKAES